MLDLWDFHEIYHAEVMGNHKIVTEGREGVGPAIVLLLVL